LAVHLKGMQWMQCTEWYNSIPTAPGRDIKTDGFPFESDRGYQSVLSSFSRSSSSEHVKSFILLLLLTGLPPSAEVVQEKPTEVVFVGTQHFISDMPPGYTPAHLRVLLSKINPSTIAVEAPANVKNPWDFAPLELRWVTKPWADQHQIPVVPIGWNDLFYQARTQNMIGAIQKAGKGDEFQKLEGRFQGELSAGVTCGDLNGEKGIDLWRQYHKALHEIYGKDTPWESVNSKILENLLGILRENRGKRIAIVFGAAHGYFLLDALSKEEGV